MVWIFLIRKLLLFSSDFLAGKCSKCCFVPFFSYADQLEFLDEKPREIYK